MLMADAGGISSIGAAALTASTSAIDAAIASGNGQQVKVELAALRQYFYNVHDVYTQLGKGIQGLPKDPYESMCIATSGIPGVASAIEASSNASLGSGTSMYNAVLSVHDALGSHLSAIAGAYNGYINVDTEKASELKGAASSDVGRVGYAPTPSSVPAVSGTAGQIGSGVGTTGTFT